MKFRVGAISRGCNSMWVQFHVYHFCNFREGSFPMKRDKGDNYKPLSKLLKTNNKLKQDTTKNRMKNKKKRHKISRALSEKGPDNHIVVNKNFNSFDGINPDLDGIFDMIDLENFYIEAQADISTAMEDTKIHTISKNSDLLIKIKKTQALHENNKTQMLKQNSLRLKHCTSSPDCSVDLKSRQIFRKACRSKSVKIKKSKLQEHFFSNPICLSDSEEDFILPKEENNYLPRYIPTEKNIHLPRCIPNEENAECPTDYSLLQNSIKTSDQITEIKSNTQKHLNNKNSDMKSLDNIQINERSDSSSKVYTNLTKDEVCKTNGCDKAAIKVNCDYETSKIVVISTDNKERNNLCCVTPNPLQDVLMTLEEPNSNFTETASKQSLENLQNNQSLENPPNQTVENPPKKFRKMQHLIPPVKLLQRESVKRLTRSVLKGRQCPLKTKH